MINDTDGKYMPPLRDDEYEFVQFMLNGNTDCLKAFKAGMEAQKKIMSKSPGGFQLLSNRLEQIRKGQDNMPNGFSINGLCKTIVNIITDDNNAIEKHEKLIRAASCLLEAIDYSIEEYAVLNSKECPNCHKILRPEDMEYTDYFSIPSIKCGKCGHISQEEDFKPLTEIK